MAPTCPNCAHLLQQHYQFCPVCSQKTHLHRLSLHDVVHDAIHYFTHADKGLLGLIKSLAVTTGSVAKEYVSGKRKQYFPPLNFFLLVATVFVLMASATSSHQPYDVNKAHPELARIQDIVQREKVQAMYERQHKSTVFMNKYANIVAMIAVPLICLLYWLFYLRAGYNYTEHLVGCMYMVGFGNLVYAIVFIPLAALFGKGQGSSIALVLVGIFFVAQLIYNSVYYYRFVGKGGGAAAWKATGVYLFVALFWFTLSPVLIYLYVKDGLGGLLA